MVFEREMINNRWKYMVLILYRQWQRLSVKRSELSGLSELNVECNCMLQNKLKLKEKYKSKEKKFAKTFQGQNCEKYQIILQVSWLRALDRIWPITSLVFAHISDRKNIVWAWKNIQKIQIQREEPISLRNSNQKRVFGLPRYQI